MNSLTLSFNDVNLTPVKRSDNKTWLSSSDLAQALGYKQSDSITRIFNRNKDEFTDSMTETVNLTAPTENKGLTVKTRIFSLRGCHLIAMFSRTEVAKDFRIWVLDVLDNEIKRQPNVNRPSTVGERNGLVKTVHMTMKRLDLGYAEAFNLVLHRFNVARIGDLTVGQVGDATEYLHRLLFAGVNVAQDAAPQVERGYHYRNNERLVSQADTNGHLWTRPLADHEFIVSTLSLPKFIDDCNDFTLPELTALNLAVSKKMVEAQVWSNITVIGSDGGAS